jgi:tetratricopeptide (TPR) repeat protein
MTNRRQQLAVVVGAALCLFCFVLLNEMSAGQTAPSELLPETNIAVKVDAHQKGNVRFRVAAGQYFAIQIANSQAESSLSLVGPDRQVQRSVGCKRGDIRVSEIAKSSGEYRVELQPCEGQPAEYNVGLSSVRRAGATDRTRVAAERTTEDADRLAQARPSRFPAAVFKYEQALSMWRESGDRAEEVRTLESLGNLYRDYGKSEKAIESLSRALELAQAQRLDTDRAAILRAIATVHSRNRNAATALDLATQALEVSRSTSDRHGEAEAMLLRGDVYYFTGEFDKAVDAYNQARAIWEDIHYVRGQAQSLLYLAFVDSDRNEFSQAFARGQKARSLFESAGDEIGVARSSALLGHVLSSTGHKQEALDLFARARSVLIDSGDLASQANLLNSIARVYADLGDYDSAIPFSKPALEIYLTLDDHVAEAATLEAMGRYYFAAGDLTNARLTTERALKEYRALANKRAEADGWLRLGIVSEALGEKTAAREQLNRSLEMSRAAADRRLEAAALLALGRSRDAGGETPAALGLYRESLRLNRAIENQFGEITALYYIANCLRRMGEIQQSLLNSEAAIEIIEKLRTSLASSGLRTFYFSSIRQHYDLHIDSLMRAGTGRDISSAFELSERARARTLLDSITETRLSISEDVDQALAARGTSLRASIEAKLERYSQLLSAGSGSKELSAVSDELRRLNAEYEELQGQLRIRSPRYSTLVQPQPLRLTDIQQQVLDKDTLLLEYALGDENSYLWAVTTEDFTSHVLPKRSEIESQVRRVRQLMTARIAMPGEKPADFQARLKAAEAQYPQAAAELSRTLLGPVERACFNTCRLEDCPHRSRYRIRRLLRCSSSTRL